MCGVQTRSRRGSLILPPLKGGPLGFSQHEDNAGHVMKCSAGGAKRMKQELSVSEQDTPKLTGKRCQCTSCGESRR